MINLRRSPALDDRRKAHVAEILTDTNTARTAMQTADIATLHAALANELASDAPRRVIASRIFGRLRVALDDELHEQFIKLLYKGRK